MIWVLRLDFVAPVLTRGTRGSLHFLVDAGASLAGHPFGKSFEDFLEWASHYGTDSQEAMTKTKDLIKISPETKLCPIESSGVFRE